MEGEPGRTGGGRPEGLGDPAAETRFLAALAGWAADQRVAGAAAGRARLRALTDAAAGSATLTGVLVDLAEWREEVILTAAGPAGSEKLAGRLTGVGRDFAFLEPDRGTPVVVRVSAVTSVWPASARAGEPGGPGGDRPAPFDLSLEAVLAAMAEQRAAVAVTTATDRIEGDLLSVGQDVMTLRAAGPRRLLVHVPTQALRWCRLL